MTRSATSGVAAGGFSFVFWQPFLEFGLRVCKPRVIGEVLPLVRVFGGIVELFTAVGIADVVPTLGTGGVVVT